MKISFFEKLKILDHIIKDGPHKCDFETHVIPLLEEPASHRYFYEHLTDPQWLNVLDSVGMFDNPPELEKDLQKGTTYHPDWPLSRLLARMSANEPNKVSQIILKLPETQNFQINNDIIKAACSMPPEISVQILPLIIKWIDSSEHISIPFEYGDLIVHLAKGGQTKVALKLTHDLLALQPDPGKNNDEVEIEGEILPHIPEPVARIERWHYGEILKKIVPVLCDTCKEESLKVFCDLLEESVDLSLREKPDGTPDEYPLDWPRAIEDHEQNRFKDAPKDLLVFAVRDAAEKLIEEKGKSVLEIIESRKYKIFKRIGLYLRQKWTDVDLEGTSDILSHPKIYYEDIFFHYELFHLLRTVFGDLPEETQNVYYSYIERKFARDEFKKAYKSNFRMYPSDEVVKKASRRRIFDKLIPIKKYLSGDWRKRFEELSEEFEEDSHPDFYFYIGRLEKYEPESPKDQKELASMNDGELLSFLQGFTASEDEMDTSLEGIGIEIRGLVSSNPEKYASIAEKFENLQPAIVRGFLEGFREVIKSDTQIKSESWLPVLRLCKWINEQPRDTQLRKGRYADLDPGWGWTRKTIAELIEKGLKKDRKNEIPYELREITWSVLEPLTDDPEPKEESEKGALDFATNSINTVRGQAMNAVVKYGLWNYRHLKEKQNKDKEKDFICNFDLIQELGNVRDVLEHRLDTKIEPLLTIRSVYGHYFPWLMLLDREWGEQNVERIFPPDAAEADFRNVAWETYIIFCAPYNGVFKVLRKEYEHAVKLIGTWTEESSRLADPDEGLAEHLMTFYWLGFMEIDTPKELLPRFFEKASDKLRGHAINFIGGSLERTEEDLSEILLNRFKTLWDYRLKKAKKDCANSQIELSSFGRWFSSQKFDNKWSIEQLLVVLKLTKKIEPDLMGIERLSQLASQFPEETVECLRLMVEGDREGWHWGMWKESARNILDTAIRSNKEKARTDAIDLVHRLGSMGHLDFRGLLPNAKS